MALHTHELPKLGEPSDVSIRAATGIALGGYDGLSWVNAKMTLNLTGRNAQKRKHNAENNAK
jgi:hypothetical protein